MIFVGARWQFGWQRETHPGRSQGWQAVDGPQLELHMAPRPTNSSPENTVHKKDGPHLSAKNKLSHNGNEDSEKKQSTIDWMSRIWPTLLERHQMSIFFYQSSRYEQHSSPHTHQSCSTPRYSDVVLNVVETQNFPIVQERFPALCSQHLKYKWFLPPIDWFKETSVVFKLKEQWFQDWASTNKCYLCHSLIPHLHFWW